MSIIKQTKDYLIKAILGKDSVPSGLFELSQYFRHYHLIQFKFKRENGKIIAISKNFRYGSIVTSGKDLNELDKNVKDAILTSFDVPSSYVKEAGIHQVKKEKEMYAFA